jgi:photosystem II stability/assembly factor-like uncharacterized protein
MPKPGADKVVTQKHRRAFSQRGGPSPVNPMRYAGAQETYLSFDDDENPPGRGAIDPIFTPSLKKRGAYDRIGSSVSAPDIPSATISFMLKHGGVPWVDFGLDCYNNFYESAGKCKDPTDFVNGWSDWTKVYSYGEATSRSESNQTTGEDSDDGSMIEVEFVFGAIYKIGALLFGEKAAPEVEREVVDGAYASSVECGSCGTQDDGTKRQYWVTKSSGAGSPGTPAEVVYTVDGGATWAQQNITGLGGTVDPTGLEIVGNYVVVLDTAGNGYWFSELNSLTGVPGTWVNVTAGFVASKQPTDIYVVSPSEVYFSANGGYIYKSTDIPSGVSVIEAGNVNTANYVRIDGEDDCIVVVGESGKIVKSLNRGATWANVTLSPTSATVRAIAVLDDFRYWIGTSGGKVYYTVNGGETFVEATIPGGTHTVIDDIYAVTDEVIHISTRVSSTARLVTSWNGGEKWATSLTATQRIQNFPTATRFNRIAAPRDVDATTMSNYIALGGLSGGGTDGALFLGVANKV